MALGRSLYAARAFFWVATRDLLPAGWRWFAACVQHRGDDEALIFLAQSAFQRVQRALQARDAALRALNQPQNNNTADEALSHFDTVMLSLMAAADVLARVAHRVLQISDNEYNAGWQRRNWTSRVAREAPDLAGLVTDGSRGSHVMALLSKLRNSIHGAALQALAVGTASGRREQTLVGLPPADTDSLLAAIAGLGSRDDFGISGLLPGRVHADPGRLMDAVVVEAIALFDRLMAATPVERLDGVELRASDTVPPDDDVFDVWSRKSIRLQLGLT